MLISKKNRVAIYEQLFNEGVLVAMKDTHAPKHPELPEVPNLQVIKALTSLKSRGYVREQFAWRHYYWYLTNEGIQYLREYLHLPPEIVPSTLKRPQRQEQRPRASQAPASGGDKTGDERSAYRRAPGAADKAGAAGAGSSVPEFRGVDEVAGTAYEDYESVDIVAKVMEVTGGKGAKCVIDGIGKSTMDISINSLAHRGIFISFGNASGAVPAFPVLRLIGKSAYVTRPKLLDYTTSREELVSRADDIFGWLKDGKLNVSVDTTFPLEQASEGHMYLEAGKSKGKVLYGI